MGAKRRRKGREEEREAQTDTSGELRGEQIAEMFHVEHSRVAK